MPEGTTWSPHWIAAAAAGIFLAGFIAVGIVQAVGAETCADLDDSDTAGYHLHRPSSSRECVGWTIDKPVNFSTASEMDPVNDVVHKIVEENQRIARQSKPYVRVALVLPVPFAVSDGEAARPVEALHALRGAFIGLQQANHSAVLEDPTLQVQLVVVNVGADQSRWDDPAVVPGLVELAKDRDHPLVAVAGMGLSLPSTTHAAKMLNDAGLPVIGSALNSDDMGNPRAFFKVAPSNHQLGRALAAYLSTLSNTQGSPLPTSYTGYLVYDRNEKDNYVRSLAASFRSAFPGLNLSDHSLAFNGSLGESITLFKQQVTDICTARPQVVFFAGRDRDLGLFVDQLYDLRKCRDVPKNLLIVTGSPGLGIEAAKLDKAGVGQLNASVADPHVWAGDPASAPKDFKDFLDAYGALWHIDQDLDDGWGIVHRDGVAVAVSAARRTFADLVAKRDSTATENKLDPIPRAVDVRDALSGSVDRLLPAASGGFYYKEQPDNDLWPIGKLVPILRSGKIAKDLPPVDQSFRTACQRLKDPSTLEVADC
ncbi:ABC transporter substrate-binding protein [Pseudonocardiaceae bacterium YIM PH 21723]|nr:ABC transporter substrate-binding protein [Pseudonocardiaceae bacterium YIM PH 21723]